MKLFQKLLVTPAVLGLLVPFSATASETNFKDVSNYSDGLIEVDSTSFNNKTNASPLLAGGEGLNSDTNLDSNFDSDSFSNTTSMSGAASLQLGAVDEGNLTQAVTATYSYVMDLNSSFTGDDNLYVGLEAGNSGSVNFVTDDSSDVGQDIMVTSMYYQFPVGNFDIAAGPLLDNDDLMPTTISTYSDKFFMAGYNLLASNSYLYDTTGAGVAISRNFENGFNASGSIIGTGASTSTGFLTDEGIDVLTLSAGYDGDNYGGGIVFVNGDDYCGYLNSYISTACTTLGVSNLAVDVFGIGGYWTPNDGKTTVSATSNLVRPEVKGIDIDNIADFQVGVEQQLGDGVLSASWKTIPLYNVASSTDFNSDTLGSYFEVYYTQPVNDSLDLTYGVAFADPDTDSGDSFEMYDYTAIGAVATFKF